MSLQDQTPLPGYLTKPGIAALFNVSEMTIRRWEKSGLPIVRVGHLRLYRLEAVSEWLAARERAAAAA